MEYKIRLGILDCITNSSIYDVRVREWRTLLGDGNIERHCDEMLDGGSAWCRGGYQAQLKMGI